MPLMVMLALPALFALGDSLAVPRTKPESVGMSSARLETIDRVAELGVAAGGYPGMAVVVGRHGGIVWDRGYGNLGWDHAGAHVDAERTIYDIASLTKVVATTTAAMILYDHGKLRPDDPVGRYLPEYTRGEKAGVTIRDLLTHRSGLPAGRNLFHAARSPAEARRLVLATPLAATPGSRYEYSDLGADVLGFVIEAITHEPLDRFVTRAVFRPLGMRNTMFRPARAVRRRVAPTEIAPPRGHPLRGEVHDENAWALGGVAGHAGLFSTAGDLAVFAQMLLDGGTFHGVRIASDSAVRRFTTRTAGTRALGWDTCAGGASCGQYLGTATFGHTGYTGTSMWIDPERRMFVIVLSNWVHAAPGRPVAPIAVLADVRSDIADIAAMAILDSAEGARTFPARFRADRAIGWKASDYTSSSPER